MKFELPKLPYEYSALEPFIDAATMEVHYGKHHQNYVNKLNEALEKHPEMSERPIEDLLAHINEVPEDVRTAVKNNGGGVFNHSMFWTVMGRPGDGGGGEPKNELAAEITAAFGDFAKFRENFNKAAAGFFGSGWTWLVADGEGKLAILPLPNQDSPLSQGLAPLMGLDLWEHAYYLKYQNRRAEYIEAWWNVVNWGTVEENFARARTKVAKK